MADFEVGRTRAAQGEFPHARSSAEGRTPGCDAHGALGHPSPDEREHFKGEERSAKTERTLRAILDFGLRLDGDAQALKLSMSLVLLVVCSKAGLAHDVRVVLEPLRGWFWHHMLWETTVAVRGVTLAERPSREASQRFHKLLSCAASIETAEPALAIAINALALAHYRGHDGVTLEALRWLGSHCPEETWETVCAILPQRNRERYRYLASLVRMPTDESLFR